MPELASEITKSTSEFESAEVKPFDIAQATLSAVRYGHAGNGLALGEPMKTRTQLWQADPNESRYESAIFGGKATPREDGWLRGLVFNGTTESFQLREVNDLRSMIESLQLLTTKLEGVSDMDSEVVALKGVADAVIARRQATKEAYFERINSYIETLGTPYWVIVDTQKMKATKDYSGTYAKSHALAELAQIDFTEDGTVRTILRQADGSLGYTTGEKYLYW